jgi:hypothetical protein
MAIAPYPKGRVFDPDAIQAMSSALDEICRSLNLPPQSDAVREVIALRMIELAERGERDADRLRDSVLANANLDKFVAPPRPPPSG